ncbi:ABC transporter permease [Nitratidesulfovibrio sp.]|uniref:ABC transporter permease n=1 Tax=Nitratidesulfovibrio sp. TaxID=2802297 RepID=UPI00333E7131
MFTLRKNSNLHLTLVRLSRNRLAVLGLIVLLLLVATAVFAPWLAPYHFATQDLLAAFEPPSWAHPLGTDDFGRDILSRIIYGARVSLQVGIFAVAIAMVFGGVLGAISGYYGGRIDGVIMRVMDILLSIPQILLAISIAAALGPGLLNLTIAVGVAALPTFARVVRGAVMSIVGQEFIEAARCMGASDAWIIARHILPNCSAPIIVQSTLRVAQAILAAAALSFLGLGIQPPFPEWGGMLAGARGYVRDYAYMTIFPGLAIMITIMALNFLGDGLRDAMDPKMKR